MHYTKEGELDTEVKRLVVLTTPGDDENTGTMQYFREKLAQTLSLYQTEFISMS